jgi:hypothetical protein
MSSQKVGRGPVGLKMKILVENLTEMGFPASVYRDNTEKRLLQIWINAGGLDWKPIRKFARAMDKRGFNSNAIRARLIMQFV